jgi:hypothetical protein
MLTVTRSLIRSMANDQAGPKLLKHRGRKALGEDVGILRYCRNMKYPYVAEGDPLQNKVEINPQRASFANAELGCWRDK